MKLSGFARAALFGLSALAASPSLAEVTRSTDDSFVSRNEVVVAATPKEVWLALISPATWWQSAHTWSGDAKNLTLMPQAGGCFCETIPEVDEPERFTLEGSVEHMRVVQAYPEQALRMVGNLGPLQSEPVAGVLTVAISKTPDGTRIVFEYVVGGPMRYEVPVISKAVDAVMAAQIAALAKPLGMVPLPSAPSIDEPAPAGKSTGDSSPAAAPAPAPATRPVPRPTAPPDAAAAKSTSKTPSVADAFEDLDDNPAAEPKA